MKVRNRFNDLDAKSWMKFLKSWAAHEDDSTLFRQLIGFFTKERAETGRKSVVALLSGSPAARQAALALGRETLALTRDLSPEKTPPLAYALLDLRNRVFADAAAIEVYWRNELLPLVELLRQRLDERRFLTVLVRNQEETRSCLPVAWMLGRRLGGFFSMRDEKLYVERARAGTPPHFPRVGDRVFFALNFRKDELSRFATNAGDHYLARFPVGAADRIALPRWFILKPPPRRRGLLLHPAKFPEPLVKEFITGFTKPGENVFDPMAGTGSTAVAALEAERNGYGCELTPHFRKIAMERLRDLKSGREGFIARGDAAKFARLRGLPPRFELVITSPPYWDMLNMKGAETQRRREAEGLRTNYSSHAADLGNCPEYAPFLEKLVAIYEALGERMPPGRHLVIVVKNIKKRGRTFTFAWDLAHRLSERFAFVAEHYWLQDDISIAPFGFGNTWVSNTFHQYCLVFRRR